MNIYLWRRKLSTGGPLTTCWSILTLDEALIIAELMKTNFGIGTSGEIEIISALTLENCLTNYDHE